MQHDPMASDPGASVRRPGVAELARSAVAVARVAAVRVVCSPAGARLAIAAIEPSTTGELAIRLDAASPLVEMLAERYVVTVTVAAPAPFSSLLAVGCAQLLDVEGSGEARTFTLELAGLSLQGPRGRVAVGLDEFWSVEVDPLAPHASRMLTHLAAAHCGELAACVRAHVEPRAVSVVPRTLDRFGLGLAVITADGVSDVVLGFPNAPVDSVRDVTACLRIALTCPCQSPGKGLRDA